MKKVVQIIEHCHECKYYRLTYDQRININRFLCQNPAWVNRKNRGRIINKDLAIKHEIPSWCPLEDYKA